MGGFAPVSWLASQAYKMPDDGSRPSRVSPVAGCDFLAHSCAAARELHPLPSSHRPVFMAPTRAHEPNSIVKRTRVDCLTNLLGQRLPSQPVEAPAAPALFPLGRIYPKLLEVSRFLPHVFCTDSRWFVVEFHHESRLDHSARLTRYPGVPGVQESADT
jgi:hypothetical protein